MSTFQKKHLVIRLERIEIKNPRPVDRSSYVRDQKVGSKITGLSQYMSSISPSETVHESNLDLTAGSVSSRQDCSLLPTESPVRVKEETFDDKDIISELVNYPPSNLNILVKREDNRFDYENKSFEDGSAIISSLSSQDSPSCERMSQKTLLSGLEPSPIADSEHVSFRVLQVVTSIEPCISVSCVPYNAQNCVSTVETSCSISDFESDFLPSWSQASVQTNSPKREREELVCKEEITSELVEYSSSNLSLAIKWEQDSYECKPPFTIGNCAVGHKNLRNILHDTREQLEVHRNASTSKLKDVSVKIVDIFPSYVRKLGKAHSSSESCACIFCRGEYKCGTRLPYLSGDCNSQFRVVSNQSGQNSTDIAVSRDKILFECNKCRKKYTNKSYLLTHFKAHHEACSPRCAKCKEGKLAQCLKKQVNKKFKCDVCSVSCPSKSQLEAHIRVHTKERPFTCNFCPKTFTQSSSKNGHIRAVHMQMRPFNCNLCQRNFHSKPQLRTHIRSVHLKLKPYSCKLCPAKFGHSGSVHLHVKTFHNKEKLYACSLCHKKYSQKSYLNVHVKAVHLNEKHSCELCPSKFAQRSELARHHKTVHLKERKYKCDVCAKAFGLKNGLITHVRTVHNEEKPFSCKLCFGAFKQLLNLQLHMQTKHSNERPFACDICQAAFKRKSILNSHMLTHDLKRCFSCAVCSEKFRTKRGAEQHLRRHDTSFENIKSFSCDLCPVKFSSVYYARLHLKSVHQGERPHSCNLCSAKFKQKTHLRIHLQGVHGKVKSFSCGLCPAKFTIKESVLSHVKKVHLGERPYRCDQCTANFSTLGSLNVHIQAVHLKERRFCCNLCPAKFGQAQNLNTHIRGLHLKEKRFSCDVCSRKFFSKNSVRNHLRTHQKKEDKLFSCDMCSNKFGTKGALRKHMSNNHAIIA